jgi:hypothetical protein
MKATVVEIKDGFAALIQEDGMFVKVKSRNLMIGDVVTMRENTSRKTGRLCAMVAAAAMFVAMIGGVSAYAIPSYYVSLDVNPGILMEVNLFERVIGMDAANEDAKAVLEGLELKNKDVEDAVAMAVDRLVELGYLVEGETGNVLIAATAKNEDKAEKLADKLQVAAEEAIEENGVEAEVEAGAVGYEMVQAAKAIEGMTPGKYNIIVNLLGVEAESEGFDGYADMTVKELMAEFTALKGAEGKATAEEAAASADNEEENGKPAENAELKEKNAEGKAEQAGSKAGNAAVETPAADHKAPNSDAAQDNAAEEKPELPVVPETPEKPELPVVPETPEIPEKPETPVVPEKPEVPVGERP